MKNKLLWILILFSTTIFAQKSVELQKYLEVWRNKNHVTGVIISVQDKTGKITDFTSGTTTLNGKYPIHSKNLFGVGSITKTFVSAAILQLQEEHRLYLDEPLEKFFPEYPRWKKITVRQLLNMTSGIYNYNDSPLYQKMRDSYSSEIIPSKTLIDIAYQQKAYFAPEKGWHYSNTNYLLLGLLIEKITHKPLAIVFKERFFLPLKLNNTFYSTSFYPRMIIKRMAHGYHKGKDMSHFNSSLVGVGAAGAIIMNSHDLLIWTRALFTPGIIINKKSMQELKKFAPATYSKAPFPVGSNFGLAVISLKMPGLKRIWFYTGVINGYTSIFIWLPFNQTAIAMQVATWPESDFKIIFPNQNIIKKIIRFAS